MRMVERREDCTEERKKKGRYYDNTSQILKDFLHHVLA